MKALKIFTYIILISVFVTASVWFVETHPAALTYVADSMKKTGENLAAVFFQESITVAQLNQKYRNPTYNNQGKLNVLIVPGHEPNYGGAEFGSLKERDMAVELGDDLARLLNNDGHYNVVMTRGKQDWNPIFTNYFATNWDAIKTFISTQKLQMKSLMDVGLIKPVSGAYHSNAPADVAMRLYGINKWANENDIDIEIHIHLNDYPRTRQTRAGEYSGFTIYVPEQQYSNSATTKAVASAVFSRLSKYNAVSNLPKESAGVVEDQDLIAVGSSNNADAASMLIEYGYIYEPQFQKSDIRDTTLKNLSFQTYLGLKDFFETKI